MKVLIEYVVNVDDDYRRAIRRYYGKTGLATRVEIQEWFKNYGESMNTDLAAYYGGEDNA